MELIEESPYRSRIPRSGQMRVPGIVYASPALLGDLAEDGSLAQVANVATLPGIVVASYAMPDLHLGYGFPIGGVAATDPAAGGVISPGGVGFDISCGVRLLAASLDRDHLMPVLGALMDQLAAATPRGAGRGGIWPLSGSGQLRDVLAGGARYALSQGFGVERDLLRCEDGGAVADADAGQVSARAVDRGLGQLGSLGSGNHFLEVQAVDEVYDAATARRFGLAPGQPVLIPGSMGTFSHLLAGLPGGGAFYSTCHGAGRVMSRHQALRTVRGPELRRRLAAAGVAVRGASARGLAEEAPEAYKDVNAVVTTAERAGLCRKVARLVPLGVVKG